MKRMTRIYPGCLALLPLCILTACSEPETHVAQVNLVNDLGIRAELALCKDDVHCGAISDLWTPKQINAKETSSITVSNEETTVFKVSTIKNGQADVRCLRIRIDKSLKTPADLLLSSATNC